MFLVMYLYSISTVSYMFFDFLLQFSVHLFNQCLSVNMFICVYIIQNGGRNVCSRL